MDVTRVGDSEADLIINGHRVEVKFSTMWKTGSYRFQQIRNQNYDLLICLGISPHEGHCWVLSKDILLAKVIGHRPQHGGEKGQDTSWLEVNPNKIEDWMLNYGGNLDDGLKILKNLKRKF